MLRYLWIILFLVPIHGFTQEPVETPDKVYGELFRAVQLSRVFPDSKTFPDCIPLRSPSDILNSYRQEMPDSGFNLKRFVLRNFRLPPEPKPFTSPAKDLLQHISGLWEVLNRRADSVVEGSSLIPLPHAYIVPGGRFREIYYWDSYFTMLGLKEAHRYEQMENMVKNFAWLIREFGHIPNGNRSYYLSRSQPPFFASMVSLLASVLGEQVYLDYSKELWIEMKYWNEPASDTAAPRQVLLDINAAENYYLSRYHDDLDIPRQESYAEDFETANTAVRQFLQVV
ncbi:MAG TPA: trehalase family glycosidase, partial [Chitinophagaceae bacterium]